MLGKVGEIGKAGKIRKAGEIEKVSGKRECKKNSKNRKVLKLLGNRESMWK